MAAFVKQEIQVTPALGWFDQILASLARELSPTRRKLRTALRFTMIATIGTGIVAACHVYSEFGAYIVWLLVGSGPMMSVRRALQFLIAEGIALAASVVLARAFAETPWMMLPVIFILISYSTYLGTIRKLSPGLLLIQVLCLGNFYDVAFDAGNIGWSSAGGFGGSVIAFAVLVIFDNWIWPDPSEGVLMESLGASVARSCAEFINATGYYLHRPGAARPHIPPATSDLPAHMTLLARVEVEGVSQQRRAVLLAAIMRFARIDLEVGRLVFAARENVPGQIREMVRRELEAAATSIAAALDNIARVTPEHIQVGTDVSPPPVRVRARTAMNALATRILEVRPVYIKTASPAEIENFASLTDAMETLTSHIERLLDEPPQLGIESAAPAPRLTDPPNPDLARYSCKVGLCTVVGYFIGLFSQRPELSTILTTVLITALPTYGAAMRKMYLRIAGAVIGGAISLAVIIVVSPNFETLPSYMVADAIVFFVSGYASLTSGKVSYAGKQIGTTFTLIFSGLSPSIDIYGPLWRIWSILLGTFVVAIATLIMWPEYAGDSLLPRLRRVINDALALTPGGRAEKDEGELVRVNSDAMRVLAEMLQVADDAQLEGRSSTVDHTAIVEATGTLRRIMNRLSYIAAGRIACPPPAIDPAIESNRTALLTLVRDELQKWLNFYSGEEKLGSRAARAAASAYVADEMRRPLSQIRAWLEEGNYSNIEHWKLEQRRAILAELQSMQRLEVLIGDLNRWLALIPGSSSWRPVTHV
jgi:Fusaric acid resistance protein family